MPDWLVLLAFALVFSSIALVSVARYSITYDEPGNLASGYLELTRGNYWLKFEALPLVKALAALPLLFLGIDVPPVDWTRPWDTIDAIVFRPGGDRLLMLARMAVLPLSLGLGALVFAWSKALFGKGAAVWALMLYCFEPNIVAHSALVTTDLGVACFLFLTVYGLFRLSRQATVGAVFLVALAFSLAVTTKFSMAALLLVVLLIGVVIALGEREIPLGKAYPARGLATPRAKLAGLAVVLVAIAVVAWVVVWGVYGFGFRSAATQGLRIDWGAEYQAGAPGWRLLAWAAQSGILPQPYVYNLYHHLSIASLWPGFLWGEVRVGGWWYYFLVTLFLKTPVALLILVGLAVVTQGREWRKPTGPLTFLVLPAVVYFVFISTSGFSMGHRHILAVLPFLMVLAAGLIPWSATRPRWIRVGLVALSLWYVASSLSVFPHYLAYFNEVAGGPDNGYKYLVDSNLDWGQDLGALKRYMDQHGIERVWLSYFGAARPEYYGIRYDRLPGFSRTKPPPARPGLATLRLPPLRGTVAISATNLQGVYLSLEGLSSDYFAVYRQTRPVAKIGHSIFVYRFD